MALLLAAVAAGVPQVRAASMVPGALIRPKDFTLFRQNGVYHLFYILNNATLPLTQNESSFGHAVSTDLYHWTQQPPVLQTNVEDWDNLHVWAPHIVYKDGLYWMFYTGVTYVSGVYNQVQRIGVATSPDLTFWTRYSEPVFAANQTSWAWYDTLSTLPAFRDPFVMPDPQHPGSWLMYYTASYALDTLAQVVGVARSDGDFTQWTDAGPLLVTWRNYSSNQVNESPHLFQHDGLWFLMFTTNSGQPLTYYTSTDPVGDIPAWVPRGRLRNTLGYDTNAWYASEYYRDGTRDLFAYVNADRIDVREMEWGAGLAFSLMQPQYFHVSTMDWATHDVRAGDTTAFVIQAANPLSGPPLLRTFLVDSLGGETAVAAESLGFAPSPVLEQDLTTLAWIARRWPAVPDSDTLTVTRIRVRTADSTAVSGVLAVRAPAVRRDTTQGGGGDGGYDIIVADDGPREIQFIPKWFGAIAPDAGDGDPGVTLGLRRSMAASIVLYDVTGRRVRTLANRVFPSGTSLLRWDGRDDDGARLGRGVYFARLLVGRYARTARLVLLAH